MLEEDGLRELLMKSAQLSGAPFFDAMLWDLTEFAGDQEFDDDVSGVLVEFTGKAATA